MAPTFFSLVLRNRKVEPLLVPNETPTGYDGRVMKRVELIGLFFPGPTQFYQTYL